MPDEEGWDSVTPQEHDEDDDQWVQADRPPVEAESEQEPEPEFDSFDYKWRNKFEGLAYLGHLEGQVKIPYHEFTVRTLKVGEKIRVVEMVQHLEPSMSYARAYRAAIVAAGLVLVDGKPLLVGSRNIDAISQKYQYVIDNWYDFVVDSLFDKINELEGQVHEILKQLGIYQPRREVVEAERAETAGEVEEE